MDFDMKNFSPIKIYLALIITFSLLTVQPAEGKIPQKTILAFGDSLTSGYGISLKKAFPAQLERKLAEEGYNVKVANAGVSGDTTSGGLLRLEWSLQEKPDFIIIELGANDMLRAIDPAITKKNLGKMLEMIKRKKIPMLLAGMKAAPNLGTLFTNNYPKMYATLAKKYNAVYYPFFLEGVAAEKGLIQDDGLHPTEEGVAVIVKNILPSVKELLKK